MNLDMTIMRTAAAFCNKIWQASKFLILAHEREVTKEVRCAEIAMEAVNKAKLSVHDQWILSR